MYWLTFTVLSLALYLPPFSLAFHLWDWAARQEWRVLLLEWGSPAWLAYASWLALVYLAVATVAFLVVQRLPESALAWTARRISRSDLGTLGVLLGMAAGAILLLAWPVLPAIWIMYGTHYSISVPVATLAGLYLLAEALRAEESNLWDDQAAAAGRISWLSDQGHYT